MLCELDLFCAWLRAAGATEGTVRNRRHYVSRLLAAIPEPWTADMDALVLFLGRPGWSPETRKNARSAVRSFYTWGVATGRIHSDPTGRLPSVRVPAPMPHPADELAVAEAMLRADPQARRMLVLGAYMGLRRAEIAAVHAQDVTERGLRVRGKGGRVRIVPIHEYALWLLELQGWAFPSPVYPGEHVTPDHVYRRIRPLFGHGPHRLRHRFATRVHDLTGSALVTQQLLGHSSVATTQRYVLVGQDALTAAVNAVA